MSQAVGILGGRTPRCNFYLRAQAAYTRPTDLAGVTTLLGTGTQLGKFEDTSKTNSVKKGVTVLLDDGKPHVTEWLARVAGALRNTTAANVDDFNTNFDNVDCDLILDDTVNKIIKVYKNIKIMGEEEEIDGDKEVLLISGEARGSKANLLDRFDYSAFS